ncbi:amino acid permease [Candidatus Micrarchaeota archaeon]|nr:amino acid permease [Candidatus Micrarchaeota archaeon]
MATQKKQYLSVMSLAMITVAALFGLGGLTENAVFGFSAIFFYGVAAVLFFIPAALISAFLASRFPTGGVNVWVSNAFGKKWGLLAIWVQWLQSVALYVTVLSFTAATIAFAFNPALANNDLFIVGIILVAYWGVTLVNFRGMNLSSTVSTYGVAIGTILPGALLILLALAWIMGGNPIQFQVSLEAAIPDFQGINSLALAIGGVLLYAGIEMSAAHITRLRNPSRDYPRAIMIAAIISVVLFVFGSLAIAAVVPEKSLSLVGGIMEAFSTMLGHYSLNWAIPVVSLLIVLGTLAQINTWIAGPCQGVLKVAREGSLPPFFQKVNKHKMPTNILLLQGAIVTVLGLVFLAMPDPSDSFSFLTAMTTQIYLVMYMLMFLAGIFLAGSKAGKNAFSIPGGKAGVWILGGVGFLTSLAAISIGFFPPSQEQAVSPELYTGLLALGMAVVVVAPLLIYHFRKRSWAAG